MTLCIYMRQSKWFGTFNIYYLRFIIVITIIFYFLLKLDLSDVINPFDLQFYIFSLNGRKYKYLHSEGVFLVLWPLLYAAKSSCQFLKLSFSKFEGILLTSGLQSMKYRFYFHFWYVSVINLNYGWEISTVQISFCNLFS